MTVQPTGVDNVNSSVLLDLPNVNTNLPPPLIPNPSPHHLQLHQMEVTYPGQVMNSEILKSIQSITKVMQQQLLLNSKTTKQGIMQMASLFQEMIKAQEKRDLDPALLAIPTFSGEASDTGCQESKMCATSQDTHFNRNSLTSQAFWCRILFKVSTRRLVTTNSQRKFYSSSLTFR